MATAATETKSPDQQLACALSQRADLLAQYKRNLGRHGSGSINREIQRLDRRIPELQARR